MSPIRTDSDYRRTLTEIESLVGAAPDSRQGDRLDILVTLVEAWERAHFPLDLPDPIAAIRFQMEQCALEPRDLVPMIGKLNRVYEILNRKRPLTLRMIWNLHRQLGILLDSLIKPPRDSRAA